MPAVGGGNDETVGHSCRLPRQWFDKVLSRLIPFIKNVRQHSLGTKFLLFISLRENVPVIV